MEVNFPWSLLPVKVDRCWEDQFSRIFWDRTCKISKAFEHIVEQERLPMMRSFSGTGSSTAVPKPH